MIRTLTVLKQTQTRNLWENICVVLCKGEQDEICNFAPFDYEDPCDEGCDDCFYDDHSCSCYCKDCMENHSSNETSSEVPTTTDSLDSNEDGSNETSSEVTTTIDTVDSNDNEEGSIQEINDVKSKLKIPPKRHRARQNTNKQTISDGKGKNGKSAETSLKSLRLQKLLD